MNRSSFLRLTGTGLAGAVLSSCASAPVSGVPVAWPPAKFATVRAFAYDCDADATKGFFQENGAVARGVLNGGGALLSPAQVQRLMPVLTTETVRKNRTACYLPHHAFVFYDAAGRVVAHAEICFNCTIQRSFPAGLPGHIHFQSVWDLLRELGVPCGAGSRFYRDLYKARGGGG